MIESVNVQVSDVASLLINLMFIKLYYSHNFISLQWLVVMSSPVVFSGLSANSKRVYSRLAVWAVATVGFAIQERKTMPSQELHSVSLSEFNALLDRCDVVILCQEGGFRCDVPLPEEIAHIKRLVKEFYNMNTEKVWRKWIETKHLFRNIYCPNFIKESGQTDDDAILNCCKHHWVYKKNKNIKAQNNKASRRSDSQERKQMVTLTEAPDNLNQPAELFPEAISYLIFKDHPMFIRDSPVNNQIASRQEDNDEDADSQVSNDAEDVTFRNRMTAKGYFKSRNTLRAEETERKKKQKKVSNNTAKDVIDLTSAAHKNDFRRTEAATQHAGAATLQAISSLFTSQMDALQRAKDMGAVSDEDLRPFILTTLTNLYSSSGTALQNLGHRSIYPTEDAEVTFVGIRKSLDGKTTADDDGKSVSTEGCAAGDLCLESSSTTFKDTDATCSVCKRRAHDGCIAVDDSKSACLKCFGFDEA